MKIAALLSLATALSCFAGLPTRLDLAGTWQVQLHVGPVETPWQDGQRFATANDKILLEGNSQSAQCSAFGWYVKHIASPAYAA